MSQGFDTTHHEERQGRVRAVLIATETGLSTENVALVDELIDANEYGIALETLTALLAEANVPIDRAVYEDIRILAADMELSEGLAEQLAILDSGSHKSL